MIKIIKTKKRGSTLILALVLTIVLFIMGIAFVSSTSIEREISENISEGQYLTDGADYTVSYIKKVLKEDLFEDPAALTGFLQGDASYDYPDENNPWLASLTPELGFDDPDLDNSNDYFYYWPQVTDLWEEFGHFRDIVKRSQGAANQKWYRLNFHYDPDPSFRDITMVNGLTGTKGGLPQSWDFSQGISWRYMVEGSPGILCRTIAADEPIYHTLLNCSGFIPGNEYGYIPAFDTRQWDYTIANGSTVNTYTGSADVEDWLVNQYNSGNKWLDSGWAFPTWTEMLELQVNGSNLVEKDASGDLAKFPLWQGTKSDGNPFNTSNPDDWYSGSRADADGDGVADSRWTRRYRVNTDGDYLYVAVRIIDNGGMINLNTAFRKPGQQCTSSGYSPYAFTTALGAIVNNKTDVSDDWDGSSVSQIDILSMARPGDYDTVDTKLNKFANYDGNFVRYLYSLYYTMANFSTVSNVDISDLTRADSLFAINKAKTPYAPKNFYLTNSNPYGFSQPIALDTGGVRFSTYDITDELGLRTRYCLNPSYPGRLEARNWQVTLNVGGGYNKSEPYQSNETGTTFDDCYENNWLWYKRCGMDLTGDAITDRSYGTGINRDQLDRRHLVTAYNKDRIIIPEFDFGSIPSALGMNYDLFGTGVPASTKCYINVIEDADNDGDNLSDLYTNLDGDQYSDDWDGDGDRMKTDGSGTDDDDDKIIWPITINNLATAIYMGLPGDSSIQDRFGRAADDKFMRNSYRLASNNKVDYDRGSLAWQLALNMFDYQEVETTDTNSHHSLINYPSGYNQEIFGFENIDKLKQDTICISKMSSYVKNITDLDLAVDLPNGCYYAIEIMNPDDVNEKDADLIEQYDIVFTDKDNKVICRLDLSDIAAGDPNIAGSLVDLDDLTNSAANSFVLCFYGAPYTGAIKPEDPNVLETVYDSFLSDVKNNTKYSPSTWKGIYLSDVSAYPVSFSQETGISTNRIIYITDGYIDSIPSSVPDLRVYALFNLAEYIYIVKRTDNDYPVDSVDIKAIQQTYFANSGLRQFFSNNQPNTARVTFRGETWWGDGNYILMPAISTDGFYVDAAGSYDNTASYNPWLYGATQIYTGTVKGTIVTGVNASAGGYSKSIGVSHLGLPDDDMEHFDSDAISTYVSSIANGKMIVQPLMGSVLNATLKAHAQLDISGLEKIALESLSDKFGARPELMHLQNISQIQEVLAAGARTVYSGSGAAGDEFYTTTLYQSLLRSRNFIDSSFELAGKIDLSEPDFMGLTDYLTVLDPAHDGIDNDGDGFIDFNSDTDMPETMVAGKININTAPWYVIARLPWVTEELSQAIVAYRDKRALDRFGVVPLAFENANLVVDYNSNILSRVTFPVYGMTYFGGNLDDENDMDNLSRYGNSAELMNAWCDWIGWSIADDNWVSGFTGPQNLDKTRQFAMGKLLAGGVDATFNEEKGFRNIAELLNVTHDLDNKSGIGTDQDYLGNTYSATDAQGAVGYRDGSNAEYTDLYGVKSKPYENYINHNRVVGSHYDFRFDIRQYGKTYSTATVDGPSGGKQLVASNPNPTGINYDDNPFYREDSTVNDQFERDVIFSRISNLVTTRSDVFTAYILVRLGETGPQRRYIGIFDRSGVYGKEDEVRLVSLYQVPEVD